MAKQRKSCIVELFMDGEVVKARYIGEIGSSDDSSLSRGVVSEFTLGTDQSKADDLMAAAELAMDSDENIT